MGYGTRTSGGAAPQDVGTLWTLQRSGVTARCALVAWRGRWEIKVIVDRDTLLAQTCGCATDAFELAERWKTRLAEQSWQQIVPRSVRPDATANSARLLPLDRSRQPVAGPEGEAHTGI